MYYMRNCNVEQNKQFCTCSYSGCSRMGICCECVAYHHRRNEIPGCFFAPEDEKTYDRTVEFFVKCNS
ncbi:MAG: DUF6485 family protein [bacterium]